MRRLEGVVFDPGVGSSPKEGVFAWVKGIDGQFRILCSGILKALEVRGRSKSRDFRV